MSSADTYRVMAAELRAKARKAPTDRAASDLDNLARCYLRLAQQAEHNTRIDVAVEFDSATRFNEEGA